MTKGRQSCLYLSSLQARATIQNTHNPATLIGTPRPKCTRSFKAIKSLAFQMHRTFRYTFPLPLQALSRYGAIRTSSDTPKSCRKFHRSSILPPHCFCIRRDRILGAIHRSQGASIPHSQKSFSTAVPQRRR